jgi:hypothetical protein
MNQSDIYVLATQAGLNTSRAQVAAAIAMAESGGNPAVETHDSDDDSYGLWQINLAPGAGGVGRLKQWDLTSPQELLNPATNARVMAAISKQGGNFNAWTTYTSGKYLQFLGTPAPGAAPGKTLPDVAGNAIDAITPGWVDSVARAGDALNRGARWLGNARNWLRVAYVIGGGMLVYAAVETLVLPYTSKAVGSVMGPAARSFGKVGL